MIHAIVDEKKQIRVETKMAEEFRSADSIVDGIIAGSVEIRNVTLEMIRQYYAEIDRCLPHETTEELKKTFLDTTLQMVAKKINMKGYREYLKAHDERRNEAC